MTALFLLWMKWLSTTGRAQCSHVCVNNTSSRNSGGNSSFKKRQLRAKFCRALPRIIYVQDAQPIAFDRLVPPFYPRIHAEDLLYILCTPGIRGKIGVKEIETSWDFSSSRLVSLTRDRLFMHSVAAIFTHLLSIRYPIIGSAQLR